MSKLKLISSIDKIEEKEPIEVAFVDKKYEYCWDVTSIHRNKYTEKKWFERNKKK